MDEYSFKWEKQLLLMNFNLRDYSELSKSIKRFTKMQKKEVRDLIISKFLYGTNTKQKMTFTIILVTKNHTYKLPNYIVNREEDIREMESFLDTHNAYCEIWVCCNESKDDFKNNFSGRFSIEVCDSWMCQTVEQIVGRYPRVIEQYTYGNMKQMYCRAERLYWGMKYYIRETAKDNCLSVNDENMNTDIYVTLTEIERKKESIQSFYDYLNTKGIKCLSLDYIRKGNVLYFIDWDTEADTKIID